MQATLARAVILLLAVSSAAAVKSAEETSTNPIQKIIELLSGLQAKIIADGEAEEKQFNEYFEWCDDATKEKGFEIKTLKGEVEDLTATIDKASSDISTLSDKIEELAASIATNEADLKAATEIRDKERADFEAVEKEMMSDVDALGRAIKILEKHASLLQTKDGRTSAAMKELANTFSVLLQGNALSLQDKSSLTAFLQNAQSDKEGEAEEDKDMAEELGAPAPDVYKSKSGGIVDVLEDMLDKAETQLSEARKEESNAQHNYNLLKQSLSDQIKFDKEEMEEAKGNKAAAEETKATAEGDLEATSADLAEAEKVLKTISMECMTAAHEHDVSRQSRAEELKALATAKKIIQKMTAGATAQSYDFLQMSMSTEASSGLKVHMGLKSRQDLANYEAVNVIKRVALATKSTALAQLASRMEAAVHVAQSTGDDPFAKVKGLIQDMIEKLLKEAAEEASHKAWCDEEMSETKEKKEKLTTIVEDLTVKIEKAEATIAKLKEEVAQLQEELAALAKLQAEMDKMRAEENETFKIAEADLSQGLEGVRMALKVLRDYYAKNEESFMQEKDFNAFMQQPKPPAGHSKSSGAAGGIIGMLEVAESDFAKNLAEARATEEQAQEEYDKTTQENKVAKTMKEQDVKYKNKERASLEKMVSEAKEDLTGSQTELDAVLEYWDKLKEQCIAKPEPYEERKRRREAEIEGLKEALSILEGEAFIQTSTGTRSLRGVRSHADA